MSDEARSIEQIRCREITDSDLSAVEDILRRGFPERPVSFWRDGLARHAARALPSGYPRYGLVLTADGKIVGVLLTLYTDADFASVRTIRCNLSSWYVDPPYRGFAALLERMAQRDRNVVYTNVTPDPQTWTYHEARGSLRICRGQLLGLPALARRIGSVSVREVGIEDPLDDLSPAEQRLVRDHLSYDCLCFVWREAAVAAPVIVQKRNLPLHRKTPRLSIPVFQIIYGGAPDIIQRIARALGRLLLRRHGIPWLVVDADGPIAGLPGRFMAGRGVKFSRGPGRAPLGDLTYTEFVLFGR